MGLGLRSHARQMDGNGVFTELAWCGIMFKSGRPGGSCTHCKSLPEPSRTMTNDSVKAYLNAIGKYPLLSKSQEILLGSQIQAWMLIKLKDPSTYTAEDRAIEKIGRRAKEKFVNCNLRLVVNIAKKYARHCKTLDLMDLVQEGNLGLIRAVEKFDPARGYAMSTYAYWWIRQSIQRAIQFGDLTIRLSINVHEAISKIKRTIEELSRTTGNEPTLEEIAVKSGIQLEEIKIILSVPRIAFSLDKRITGSEGGSNIIDVIPDEKNLNTIEGVEEEINTQEMITAINDYLDEKTKIVILSRNQTPPVPWKRLSKEMGISIEKLQKMEESGIKKCSMLLSIKNKLSI